MNSNQTLVAKSNAFKKLTFSLLLLCAFNSYAQVGVGTQNPATTLDVAGAAGDTPGALNTIDGIAVPVVTDDMTATATAGSKISQLVYSNNAASTGFYFWNGTAWTALSGGGAAVPDFTVGTILYNVDVTATPDFSANTENNVLDITASGAGPGATNIILPTPSSNAGRIMVIINRGAKGVYVSNSPNGNVGSSLTEVFFCTGDEWIK
jgi:hypothetical protein